MIFSKSFKEYRVQEKNYFKLTYNFKKFFCGQNFTYYLKTKNTIYNFLPLFITCFKIIYSIKILTV